jgi:23S rRNA pseudouridine1911/1915/1917 synthase
MALTTLSTTVDANNVGRIDTVVRTLSGASHSQVRGMFDHGCVSIDGGRCYDKSTAVGVGAIVAIQFDPTQRYREKKQQWDDRTFRVAWEDNHLIVVDKSAGTLTVPTDHGEENTLVDRVSMYLNHSKQDRQAHVVHRLDRDVSGLLTFGKRESVANQLIEQFRQRKPRRVYAAIVAGVLSTDSGTYQSHLATGKNLDRFAAPQSASTETAITHFRVLKRMMDTTLVEVTLETGRRNQIRVHFADAGHPVLGDRRYKQKQARHSRWIRKRIALHARMLGFDHPITGEALAFESPLPAAIEKFLTGSSR